MPLEVSFLYCFGYLDFLVFPYDVEYCFFKVCGELCLDFDGVGTESVDGF